MFVGRIYNSLYLVALVEIPFIIYVDKKKHTFTNFLFLVIHYILLADVFIDLFNFIKYVILNCIPLQIKNVRNLG